MSTPWTFSGPFLDFEARFGYRQQVWPRTADSLALRPGMRVLDVGCGPGPFTRFLAESLREGEVVGVDRDAALLAQARERSAGATGARIRYEEGEALKLPFGDAEFDAVVSSFLLCILPRPIDALREMRRVARPGATIASLSCFCKSGILPTFGGLHELDFLDRLSDLRRRYLDARRTTVRNPALGLPDGRDLDVWGDYRRAGLVDLRIEGFLTMFTASDARWSDQQAREFVEGRRDIELAQVDQLTPAQRATIARAGVPDAEIDELRDLIARKYAWLLEDTARIRSGMELLADPAVLITGRVPA